MNKLLVMASPLDFLMFLGVARASHERRTSVSRESHGRRTVLLGELGGHWPRSVQGAVGWAAGRSLLLAWRCCKIG